MNSLNFLPCYQKGRGRKKKILGSEKRRSGGPCLEVCGVMDQIMQLQDVSEEKMLGEEV